MGAAAPLTALVIAHRAANTVEGIHRAAEVADVVEADVHLFRGRLEVRHAKTLGPSARLWERWYLLPRGAPRPALGEVLEAADGRVALMLDLKGPDPRLPDRVLSAARRARLPGDIIVCGRVWPLIDRLRGTPGVRTMHSVRRGPGLRALMRRPPGSVEGVSIHRDLLSRGVVEDLRERIPRLWTWPVDDPDDALRLAEWGVNGFISDAPGRLGPLRAATSDRTDPGRDR